MHPDVSAPRAGFARPQRPVARQEPRQQPVVITKKLTQLNDTVSSNSNVLL